MSEKRRSYTPEQKAEATARVLAGEDRLTVAAELDLPVGTVDSWHSRTSTDLALASDPTRTRNYVQQINDDLAALLHANMVALRKHAELYGNDDWIAKQSTTALLESTRTLGRAVLATMDRLAGREPRPDDGSNPDKTPDSD